ncbi:MAG: ATP synthase F0 subunit B [Endomicrobium sp.]|jgi:F-type H+-transporting ATPase subunit b|uniref:ATP synthase F0 subunit B n=1 Tax=Candidatus Endomicrobiellum cubanum TaxID=3242325 RepID=UPI00282DD2B2|nr:ATP synthase F0 subunit B [Endomicrobium sp.]MDR2396137.1 ATP synthase F0 subunit B [Endomicrobium sp.]
MEIIQKFGLEAKLFLFQLVNFLIIVFILKRFLFAPLRKMLEQRKRKIEQSLLDAENAKLALDNASQERKKMLSEAKLNADKLTSSVKIAIEEEKQKATIEAKHQAQTILDEARQQAGLEFDNVSKQLGKMSIDLSQKILKKVFSDLFSEEEKQKLMSRALEKIDEKITN